MVWGEARPRVRCCPASPAHRDGMRPQSSLGARNTRPRGRGTDRMRAGHHFRCLTFDTCEHRPQNDFKLFWGGGGACLLGIRWAGRAGGTAHSVFCRWRRTWPLPSRPREPEAFRQMSDAIRPGAGGPPGRDAGTCTPTGGRGRQRAEQQGRAGRAVGCKGRTRGGSLGDAGGP